MSEHIRIRDVVRQVENCNRLGILVGAHSIRELHLIADDVQDMESTVSKLLGILHESELWGVLHYAVYNMDEEPSQCVADFVELESILDKLAQMAGAHESEGEG